MDSQDLGTPWNVQEANQSSNGPPAPKILTISMGEISRISREAEPL